MDDIKLVPLIFVGPVLSRESGIPIYKNHLLERPEMTFRDEGEIYRKKALYFSDKAPSEAHRLLADYVNKVDAIVVTQNLDSLLEQAGISGERISHTVTVVDLPGLQERIGVSKGLEELLGGLRGISKVLFLGVRNLDGLGEYLDKIPADVPKYSIHSRVCDAELICPHIKLYDNLRYFVEKELSDE